MPPLPFGKGMKGATAGAAGRGGMRLHATATASASAAAGARGHLVQKSTTHSSAASRTSLGSRPLTADAKLTVGGSQDLRMLHIQGPPDRAAAAVQALYKLLTTEGAPRNVAFFRTKAGQYKMKVVVQTWLVGTIVGRDGHRIRELQERTGCRMQIVPLQTALKGGPRVDRQPLTGAMVVLEAAAESVDSLAAGTQGICEAIAGNPKYKPFVMKHLPPGNRHSSSGGSSTSSSDSSPQGGAARAA